MIDKVATNCKSILIECCSRFPFHNLDHTEEVVSNVRTIGSALGMSSDELEPVIIAAWFHDTGFRERYDGHEAVSAKLAEGFLRKEGYPEASIQVVVKCIEATRVPQRPAGPLSEILVDADLFHISNEHFFYRKLLLRREWEVMLNKRYTDQEWHLLNLSFLLSHQFFTTFGKQILMEGQSLNESKVRKILAFY